MKDVNDTKDENGVHTLNIVVLHKHEAPHPSDVDLSGRTTQAIDIYTATKEQLLQARTDLNNDKILQEFNGLKNERFIRGHLHAEILNQLQTLEHNS